MGYCYQINANGRHILVCDSCGVAGGVRRRTCPARVEYFDGTASLPHCPAPAYCQKCFTERGKAAGIHGDRCAKAAAEWTERNRVEAARWKTDPKVSAAWGSWLDGLDEGQTLVLFTPLGGIGFYRVVASADYKSGGFLSDYPNATETEVRP